MHMNKWANKRERCSAYSQGTRFVLRISYFSHVSEKFNHRDMRFEEIWEATQEGAEWSAEQFIQSFEDAEQRRLKIYINPLNNLGQLQDSIAVYGAIIKEPYYGMGILENAQSVLVHGHHRCN